LGRQGVGNSVCDCHLHSVIDQCCEWQARRVHLCAGEEFR
jgi:hypothetical protein